QYAASPSSSSSSGWPMLPVSAVRWPPTRSRCASSAEVVLLPLVPVTHTVRASGRAANHSAVPPMKRVPCAAAASTSGRYGLMPGDLITISKADSRSAVASVSTTSPGSPSARASSASALVQNRVSHAGNRCSDSPLPVSRAGTARSAAYAARPPRPQPHSATRLPASAAISGGKARTQALPQRRGDAVLVIDDQQGFDIDLVAAQLRRDLAREPGHDR